MSTQPEALRLADAMDAVNTNNADSLLVQMAARSAAAELRRLHAINAELVEALKECVEDSEQAVSDYLQKYGTNYRPERLTAMSETVAKARAALAKAEGREA